MIKAVIYARYSCDNQREESIEGQLRECKEFATRKGYTLVGSYIDRAMSAKTDNRPEFQRMIKESAKELFDVVIVWKLDRFARNRYDSAHYKATLRRNGVKVVSATEVISEGAEGIILESVLEGYAEYYSAELSEKVIRGMTENALKCQYNGGYIPVGYKVDENKHYQIDELTAPFVKEAFLMYVNGRHIKKIVEYFNENGIRSSRNKPMTKTTVSTILQNRKYIGEYQYRDIVVPDGIPAIISKELFALAQQRTEQNKYAPSASRSEIKYLLTGKLMCGDCGSVYAGESGTGRTGQKYHYYKCVKAKKRDGCERKAIKKDEVEEAVIEATVENIFVDEVIEEIADRVISWQEKESTLVSLYQRELAEVEKSIANLLAAIEQGIITSATKNRMAELEGLKIDLEVKIAREEIQTQILTKDQVKFWLKNMEKLDLASIDNRQRIINTFVNSIYVYEDRFEVNFNCREGFETIPLDIERFVSRLEIVGEAIGAWLTNYRMNQAAELLIKERDMSIADIGSYVGYDNAGKFTVAFNRDMTGAVIEYARGLAVVKSFGKTGASMESVTNAVRGSKKIHLKIEWGYIPGNALHLLALKCGSVGLAMAAALQCMRGEALSR